nr:hypothetical protein CFP56_38405 [Quercus suber]
MLRLSTLYTFKCLNFGTFSQLWRLIAQLKVFGKNKFEEKPVNNIELLLFFVCNFILMQTQELPSKAKGCNVCTAVLVLQKETEKERDDEDTEKETEKERGNPGTRRKKRRPFCF